MSTNYKQFCQMYKEKLANDKDIKENKLDWDRDYRERISFRLNMYISIPAATSLFSYYDESNLFILDEEDLEYLFNKYSKKLQSEMDQKIENIKKSYENI